MSRPFRTRTATTVLTLLVALVLPVTLPPGLSQGDGAGLEWGEDVQLSNSTEVSDDPTLALMPGGGMVVAWRERLLGRFSVFFAVLDEDGAVVGPRTQLGGNLTASMDPAVVVGSGGRLHFVWTAMEDQELWYARADRDGVIDNGPLRLTNAGGDSAEASMWMDGRDHIHLVWFDGRDGPTNLYYMQLDHEGGKVVQDTLLVRARTEQESAILMDEQGDLHVLWNGPAAVGQLQWNHELHYTKVSPAGEVLVPDRLVATSRGTIGFPDVALDLSNDLHVVWPEGVGPRERVMYAMLDTSGRTLEGPRELVGEVGQAARDVAIAADGNGRLHLVWSQGPIADTDLMYVTMDPGRSPADAPTQLTDALGTSSDPSIGLSAKGEPRVVWSDARSGNAEVYLKVATLPVAGVDLAVYARDIVTVPSLVTAGEPMELTVTLHNHGDARSPTFNAHLLLDGGPLGSVIVLPIDAGGTLNITKELTLGEGEHVVSVLVDPYDAVEETSEHNNGASRAIMVYPPGTLVADAGPDIETEAGETTYLDASGTIYRGDGVLSYEWDFGDGSAPGHGEYVEHVFGMEGDLTVTLRVSDGAVEDTDTCLVTVLPRDDPPRAVISPSGPVTADRLEPVRLAADLSSDDHGLDDFSWDLGDGTTATTSVVDHLYTRTGVFVVTLTVTDSAGLVDVNKTTVTVVNLPPEVTGGDVPEEVDAGEEFILSVTTEDPDGSVSEVGWDFDASDGVAFDARGEQVTHSFGEGGTYNVTCIVRDNDGGQSLAHYQVVAKRATGSAVPGPGLPLAVLALVIIALGAVRRRTSCP